MTIQDEPIGMHKFAERREALSNLRHMYGQSQGDAPFAFFIQDPSGDVGKSNPGGSNYKKLILNPNATSAEKQAQLMLFKDLIIGLQATRDSKSLFRSDIKSSIEASQGQRIFNYKVITLPPSKIAVDREIKTPKPEISPIDVKENRLEEQEVTVKSHPQKNSHQASREAHLEEAHIDSEEERMEIDEDAFVNDELFEQLFMQTLHPSEEGLKTTEEDEESVDNASKAHHEIEERSSKPTQTTNLAAKTRNLALDTLLNFAVDKASEQKKKFIENERKKDELAAEKKRDYIKSDEKKAEIKQEKLKSSTKNKTVDKELEANVEFNDALSKGKKPSLPSKFKLPGS